MKYQISLSKQHYASKSEIVHKSMTFQRENLEIKDIIEKLRTGHAICHNMQDFDEPFGVSTKCDANFTYTQYVPIDIDGASITPQELYNALSIKPTYLYTSYSSNDTLQKYHLLYLFDDKIKDVRTYKYLYNVFKNDIKGHVENIDVDDHNMSESQMLYGSNAQSVTFSEYFNPTCFDTYTVSNFIGEEQQKTNVKEIPINNNKKREEYILSLSGNFQDDLYNMRLLEFVAKYSEQFEYRETSPLVYNNGYAILPKDFTEIRRRWFKIEDGAKGKTYKREVICTLQRGRRHKGLFILGMLFKGIFPNISDEHLIFCLAFNVLHFVDNSDKEITPYTIIQIAKECQNCENKIIPYQSHKYKIDKNWCRENNISVPAHRNHVRKILNDEAITKYYDDTKSINENLITLQSQGVKVSKSKLYEYRKNYGKIFEDKTGLAV